jgi:hypothetical protein
MYEFMYEFIQVYEFMYESSLQAKGGGRRGDGRDGEEEGMGRRARW